MIRVYAPIIVLICILSGMAHSQNLEWVKQINGTHSEYPTALKTDNQGNIYVAGYFTGAVDFEPSSPGTYTASSISGADNLFVVKLNSYGRVLWSRDSMMTSDGISDYDKNVSMVLDQQKNTYITGNSIYPDAQNPNISIESVFVIKFDSVGTKLWSRRIGAPPSFPYSGIVSNEIATDENSNVYVGGGFVQIIDFDPSSTVTYTLSSYAADDAYLLKLDRDGNFVWVKDIKVTQQGSVGGAVISSLALNKNLIYIAGMCNGNIDYNPSPTGVDTLSSDSAHLFIAKYDTSGNFIWVNGINTNNNNNDIVNSLAIDKADQSVYAAGTYSGTADFDPAPSNSYQSVSTGLTDGFVLKLDSSGNMLWVNQMRGAGYNSFNRVSLDEFNNVYAGGYYSGTAFYNAGADTLIPGSETNSGAYVIKSNQNGQKMWMRNIANSNSLFMALTTDVNNSLYLGSVFKYATDFNEPSASPYPATPHAAYTDMYIAKYDTVGLTESIIQLNKNSEIKVFPNPTQKELIITLSKHDQQTAEIADLTGRKLIKLPLDRIGNTAIDISSFTPGMYILNIIDKDHKSAQFKVIKE